MSAMQTELDSTPSKDQATDGHIQYLVNTGTNKAAGYSDPGPLQQQAFQIAKKVLGSNPTKHQAETAVQAMLMTFDFLLR